MIMRLTPPRPRFDGTPDFADFALFEPSRHSRPRRRWEPSGESWPSSITLRPRGFLDGFATPTCPGVGMLSKSARKNEACKPLVCNDL